MALTSLTPPLVVEAVAVVNSVVGFAVVVVADVALGCRLCCSRHGRR